MRTASCIVMAVLLVAQGALSSTGLSRYQVATPIQNSLSAMQYSVALQSDDDEFGPINARFGSADSPQKNSSPSQKKSLLRAVAFSALVPGAGEWYVGNQRKASIFFGAEAAIWVGFASFTTYKNWKYDDMIRFGDQAANARLAGRDDAFLDLVGFYQSIDEYNTLGRATDVDRPYLPDTPENHWRWQSEGDEKAFRSLKNSYREARRRSQFMLGLAVVNRIVSIVDVIRDVKQHNSHIASDFSALNSYKFQFSFHPESDTQVRLTILTPF